VRLDVICINWSFLAAIAAEEKVLILATRRKKRLAQRLQTLFWVRIAVHQIGRCDLRSHLYSRCFEHEAIACAFDPLKLDGDDLRRLALSDRKAALQSSSDARGAASNTSRTLKMPGEEAFEAACELGLEGRGSKRLTAPCKSGLCKAWIKVRNELAGGSAHR
jgi:hypothetical protein